LKRSNSSSGERFKRRADDMSASAVGMKKLAEAAEPLYRTLNDDQKRRLVILAAPRGHHRSGEHRRWRERTDFERRGERRRSDQERGGPGIEGAERL
jgi:hypothetical protein